MGLLDKGAAEEAKIELDRWLGPDIHIVEFEKRVALLNEAREKEKAEFLKEMDVVARDELAIKVAEVHETLSHLETEKEFFVEKEIKALQKEEATLLVLMDQKAEEEAEMESESEEWQNIESYLAEERAAFLKEMDKEAQKEKDIEEYLEKMRTLWGEIEGFAC